MLNADFERPDRDDYDLEEEYIEALTDYKVKKAMAPQLKRLEDEEKEKRARQEIDAHFDGLDEVLADGEEKYRRLLLKLSGNFPLSKKLYMPSWRLMLRLIFCTTYLRIEME